MDLLAQLDWRTIATTLILSLMLFFAGLPQRLWTKTVSILRRRKLEKSIASGIYDNNTIESAVRFYVRPKYASVDPAEYQEPAEALLNARADLFTAMDDFLDRKSSDMKFLFILADSGMGKTSFLLNYFHHNYSRILRKHRNLLLASLSTGELSAILQGVDAAAKKNVNLFLDAFDEDTSAMGRASERLNEILQETRGFRTVTVSCRTQFFLSEESIPLETGLPKIGVVPLGESKFHKFARMYISPFDSRQVNLYLNRRYPGILQRWRRDRAREMVAKVPSLSVRPMLLAHIPEIIDTKRSIESAVNVYDAMIDAWVEREHKWINAGDLLSLSKMLAMDFYKNRARRGGEFATPEEITRIARSLGVSALAEHITSRSLLNRTGDGKFKFAHRSILEYFITDWILNEGGGQGIEITDQIAKFMAQRLGCASQEVETFFTSCSIEIALEPPILTLNHPTNFGLFERIDADINWQKLLHAQAGIGGDSKKGTLGRVLLSFADMSPYAEESRISKVRIVCSGVSKNDSVATFYAMVWFGGISICRRLTISMSDVGDVFSGVEFESEFVIVGVPPKVVVNPDGFTWSIEKRSSVVSTEAVRAGNLSAMYHNRSVSFEYIQSSNRLFVRVIQGTLFANGPLALYGVMSDLNLVETRDSSYIIKPISLDASVGSLH